MSESVLHNQQTEAVVLAERVIDPNFNGKYVRARENPFFNGLRIGNTSMNTRTFPFETIVRSSKQKITSSASVTTSHNTDDIQENVSGSVDLFSSQIAAEDNIYNDGDIKKPLLTVNSRKPTVLGISLAPCAATFYYGSPPRILDVVENCESIQRLNLYLKASKEALNAGVPGRFLRAVLGHVSDAASFISTIMYSFYLNQTDKTSQYCTVPVINIKRQELNSLANLNWLLKSCNIHQPSLVFIDEVDLSYYHLFGSLKVVILNADKLAEKHEALKDSVVEIFNCKKNGSCCAIIAEKLASTLPEILAGKGFSRLLQAGILLDTENLTSPECTCVDRYMSTLLLNGAGRFGCDGLYQILRSNMGVVSRLGVGQILRKDFRKWTIVGMSAIRISIPQLLSYDENSIQEVVLFQQLEKLRLLVIVSGHDHHKSFKEMLISAESEDLMKDLLLFLNAHDPPLPIHQLYQPGLSDEMRAFTTDNVASRTIMEQLLQDFCTT